MKMKWRIVASLGLVAGCITLLHSQTPTGPHSKVIVSDSASPPFQAWIDESAGDMRFTDNGNSNVTLTSLVGGGAVPWTAVPSDVIPDADSTRDLGENATPKRWAEIWGDQVDGGNLRISANKLISTDTNGNIDLDPNGTGKIIVTGIGIQPDTTNTRDLGTSALRFNDVYLNDIYGLINGSLDIWSDTDVIIEIDADNDGTETFEIRDGASAPVLILTEVGLLTIDGGMVPDADNQDDLGTSALHWNEIFTNDILVDNKIVDDDDTDNFIHFQGLNSNIIISANAGTGSVDFDGDIESKTPGINSVLNWNTVQGTFFIGDDAAAAIIRGDTDVQVVIDFDNDGTETFQIINGAATEVLSVTEAGFLQIDGDLTVDGNDINSGTNGILDLNGDDGVAVYVDADAAGTDSFQIYNGVPTEVASINESGDLQFDGGATALAVYADTVGATNRDLYIDDTGVIGYVSSSERVKAGIEDVANDDVSGLYSLRPRKYDRIKVNDDGTTTVVRSGEIGLIAEEVNVFFPDAVSYERIVVDEVFDADSGTTTTIYGEDKTKPMTVNMSRLVVPLLREVQRLNAEVEAMEQRLFVIETRLGI